MSRLAERDYDSAARRPAMVEELVDLYCFRDLVVELVVNSLKTRYKRSWLGVGWTLLNPLLTMAVMTMAFSGLFRTTVDHYPLYVLSGILLWNFFAQTTAVAMTGLVWNGSNLLKRIYLPRSIFSVAAAGVGLTNVILALVPLAAAMLLSGVRPSAALLYVPVALLQTAAFVLGVALLLSVIAIFFVDMIDIFQAAVTALFYLTPVIYPASIIPGPYRIIAHLNPMHYLLDCFRVPIIEGRLADSRTLVIAAASALGSLLVGWALFTWKADEIAYRG